MTSFQATLNTGGFTDKGELKIVLTTALDPDVLMEVAELKHAGQSVEIKMSPLQQQLFESTPKRGDLQRELPTSPPCPVCGSMNTECRPSLPPGDIYCYNCTDVVHVPGPGDTEPAPVDSVSAIEASETPVLYVLPNIYEAILPMYSVDSLGRNELDGIWEPEGEGTALYAILGYGLDAHLHQHSATGRRLVPKAEWEGSVLVREPDSVAPEDFPAGWLAKFGVFEYVLTGEKMEIREVVPTSYAVQALEIGTEKTFIVENSVCDTEHQATAMADEMNTKDREYPSPKYTYIVVPWYPGEELAPGGPQPPRTTRKPRKGAATAAENGAHSA